MPITESERRSTIRFPYTWKEVDRFRIDLPEGYTLDSADNPGGLRFGAFGSYTLDLVITRGAVTSLSVDRELTLGANGELDFDAHSYGDLKRVFDQVRVRDTHSISIKAN
jgi:hypothetical protein